MNAPANPPAPDRSCDIVMKGGITSGVVYPRAIAELAKTFRLRNVGGTSAGAIAAAAAAAAECGRRRNPSGNCFDEIAKLPEFLAATNSSGHTNLFTFFQPQAGTRRLFRVLSAALNASGTSGAVRILRAALVEYWAWLLLGAGPGAALALLACNHPLSALTVTSFIIGLIVAAVGGLVAVAVALVREFGRAVPGNYFGLCTGMEGEVANAGCPECGWRGGPEAGRSQAVALTPWLTEYLNRVAGLAEQKSPLTFGQLWNPSLPPGEQPALTDCAVRLEMMTTCLTWGRPFRLPFRHDDEELRENIFYFRESEFRELFPASVVDWLCQHGRPSKLRDQWRKEGYHPLPDPWNLPVVVATRMSLSFPILLSAVPLYAYDKRDDRDAAPPRRCWFSDGGICSNFPMHFFDSPLPRWPTLGFNLVPADAVPGSEERPEEKMKRGWMPANNGEFLPEIRNEFSASDGLPGIARFIGSIIGTMQNWSDNTLGRMPGYRDRIAHVPLKGDEGGLNLNMPDTLIQALGDRGRETGIQFIERFGEGSHPMNWENHRWLRLRSALASLGDTIKRLELSCSQEPPAGLKYEDWLKQADLGDAPSYKFVNHSQRQLALETLRDLRAIAARLNAASDALDAKAPRPRPELRPRPRI
jgi:predicted acylesterase/phospholipase RssA